MAWEHANSPKADRDGVKVALMFPFSLAVVLVAVPFLTLGLVFMVFGGWLVFRGVKDRRMRRRMRKTPVQSIAGSAGNGPVMIQGRVRPSEDGLLPMPILGGHVVWYSLTVSMRSEVSSGTSQFAHTHTHTHTHAGHWYTIHEETFHRAFLLDDGSGQHALVQPRGASVLVHQRVVGSCDPLQAPSHEFQSFLALRGISITDLVGMRKTLRCEVGYIAAGDEIRVLGPSQRTVQHADSAYRMGPAPPLMVSLNEHGKEPFCITTKSNTELEHNGGPLAIGILFFVAGLVSILVTLGLFSRGFA